MIHFSAAAVLAGTTARAVLALLLLVAQAGVRAAEVADGPDDCAVLAALDLQDAVGAAVSISGAMIGAEGDLPARCRVTGTIAPEVGVEAWLPVDSWNGKLLVAGCYGLCGSIQSDQMADAAARGYATATTDGGHSHRKYPDSAGRSTTRHWRRTSVTARCTSRPRSPRPHSRGNWGGTGRDRPPRPPICAGGWRGQLPAHHPTFAGRRLHFPLGARL